MTGIVVASSNAQVGIAEAIDVLRRGGTAIDAVVAGIKPVEANPDDHSVGFAGLPNLIGQVELDASIMDGRDLAAGSIGALRGYQDAIELARRVMDDLPHVLVTGDGAARFARESGLDPIDLLTPEAERIWRRRLDDEEAEPDARSAFDTKIRELVGRVSSDPEVPTDAHGTVNVIARDHAGNLACGVSTSGWAWKYPGRLGDSPIIGAGNYADNRWGAAACTGRGEMAQRCCTAHAVVTFLRFGIGLDDALRTAMADLNALTDRYASEINIVAIDRDGNHAGISSSAEKTYIFMREDMTTYDERPRAYLPRGGAPASP